MIARVSVVLSVFVAAVSAYAGVTVINNCNERIDPGFYPQVEQNDGLTGGFPLEHGQREAVVLPNQWHGRIWGRTGCDDEGQCETGTCPGGEDCTGPAPAGPTLAQFNINATGTDYFNPSTVDGFNIPIRIVPGIGCNTGPVECTGLDEGTGCDSTSSCPTGVNYNVFFCY